MKNMKYNERKVIEMREKIIYSRRVAIELRKRGFEILRTEPNPYKPQFDVYIMKDSDELNRALSEITAK